MNELEAYFAALAAADAGAAAELMDRALLRGESPHRLIREVIVPAQRRVGQMWFDGRWSVADEHAATAVAEQALTLVAPPTSNRTATMRVVFACAEGEWHGLPARLAAELARTADVDVVVLGASVPAQHLQRHLRARRPDALALSATLATNLISASRSIEAAHVEGVPVIVGGAAWGSGRRRAAALGADLRLDDPADLSAALVRLAESNEDPSPIPAEALLLEAPPQELLAIALERHAAVEPWVRDRNEHERAHTFTDLRWLTRHAAAAVACDDATIVADLLTWLIARLAPRGVPAAVITDGCQYLADVLEPDAPRAASILRREADRAAATASV